jgi:hypothetical protein
MKFRNGFAMFDVLLAVILMAIAAVGSYSLVKSFKSSSSVQQVTQYANTITQNFMPFLEGVSYDSVLDADSNMLSNDFLLSIGIPSEELSPEACADSSSVSYCTVKTGLHTSTAESLMEFAQFQDASKVGASYFIIGFDATSKQANALAQNLGVTYSVFCDSAGLTEDSSPCGLDAGGQSGDTSVFLVFPKSGSAPPAGVSFSL